MTRILASGVMACCVATTFVAAAVAAPAESARGMVATVNPLATAAGVAAFERGGNAVDAAIAAALTLAVVDGHNSGIGGGCLILIRSADRTITALDAREMAPARAHRNMYLRDGKLDVEASQTGPLAAAVPGALAGYAEAVQRYGRRPFADSLGPAAKLADEGFAIDRIYAAKLAATAPLLARFPGTRAVLLKSDGKPYVEGEVLRQPDLARTLRAVAEQGVDWFYRGPLARDVGAWMRDNGGLMTAEDFAAYHTVRREPLKVSYRGYSVVGFPPPSSGGIHVAQMLEMLGSYDLAALQRQNPADVPHLLSETMKRAFADRAYWLGDPDFARVPRGLVDPNYAKQLASTIDLTRATSVKGHGEPPDAKTNVFEKHTTHVAAADAEGNWIALTTTVNTTFGCKVIVPGTGVILNNEMDDFSLEPGVPNSFGLLGAEANAIEPGKRPLSSMSPTIVLRDGKPVFTVGAAGGPTIISQVLQALVRRLDLGLPVEECLAQPRVHHQWAPDELRVESSMPKEIRETLVARGHRLKVVTGIGVSQAIQWDETRQVFRGAHDPRVPGSAAGPR